MNLLRRFHELLFLLTILLLFIIGFFGPKYMNMPQLLVNFKAIQNNFSNPIVSINKGCIKYDIAIAVFFLTFSILTI